MPSETGTVGQKNPWRLTHYAGRSSWSAQDNASDGTRNTLSRLTTASMWDHPFSICFSVETHYTASHCFNNGPHPFSTCFSSVLAVAVETHYTPSLLLQQRATPISMCFSCTIAGCGMAVTWPGCIPLAIGSPPPTSQSTMLLKLCITTA